MSTGLPALLMSMSHPLVLVYNIEERNEPAELNIAFPIWLRLLARQPFEVIRLLPASISSLGVFYLRGFGVARKRNFDGSGRE